ncbi:TPR-like protein, partial [Cryphonectria parasitica EP155]
GPRNIVEPSAEIKLLLSQASDSLLRRELDNALAVVEEVIRQNAETHDAWMMLSSIYQERGQMREAIMAMCFAAHLRPRDFYGWMTVAQFALDDTTPDGRQRNLDTAQMCFSAAIRANPKSMKARIGKANCALEAGRSSTAAAEYVKVLQRRPYDMAVLRNMAEAAFDTRSARKYVEKARGFYELAIRHVREGGQRLRGTFEWSDVIIYVEMCAFLERYSDAALALRSLSRLLIGRQHETFWDRYVDDDREWDQEDDRMREVPEYKPDTFPYEMYGPALPLDLRAKLAIFRLKLGQEEEATRHLQWLTATPGFENAPVHEYFEDSPFVIKELANQLFENRRITTALEFYEFYERLTGEVDSEMLVQKGRCYLDMEDQATAEDLFLRAIEVDEDNIEARLELAQMYETHQEKEEAFLLVNEAIALEDEQRREDEENEEDDDNGGEDEDEDEEGDGLKKKGQRPKRVRRQHMRRMASKAKREIYEHNVTESFQSKYHKVQELRERMASGDIEAEDEWMAAAQDLVDDFRSFKEFYPWDKYLNFMGYGSFFKENEKRAAERHAAEDGRSERAGTAAAPGGGNRELAAMAERLQQNLAPGEDDSGPEPVLRRHEHRGIPFDQWLDLFLGYAISLARRQQAQEAYIVCQSARDSIVYKSSDNTFLIHVAWAACAVHAADEETCVAVARFFMRSCHAATDSYRVFSALCRVCQSPVSWYASGPAQKYILRQIKAMDRTLLPADLAQKAMGAWDTAVPREEALGPRHEALDVTLLMLYGHILLTSTSYTYALNYFLRAAALDPTNPMVNLSVGTAYVHYAMKRQAENRQFIIAQGMHYMFEYYRIRSRSVDVVERLEAHYNIARCYHLLGIYHLAAQFYARALGEAKAHARRMEENEEKGDSGGLLLREFVYESAVNLRTFALTNGDYDGARALTETWLVL